MTDPTITITPAEMFYGFRQLAPSLTAQNGVLIVGLSYARHGSLTAPLSGLLGTYTGASLAGAWPLIGTGETPVTTSAAGVIDQGIVRYHTETGVPGATKGTQYGSVPNAITHNGATTVWTGTGYSVALGAPLAIGDYVRLDDNGTVILHTTVVGFGSVVPGGIQNILYLADNIPVALRGALVYSNVTIGQITQVPVTNAQLTKTTALVTIPAAFTYATSRTGTAYPVISATLTNGTLLGKAYISYQALASGTFVNSVKTVTTAAEVAALFTNYQNPEDGLGFAAYIGLSPPTAGLAPAPIKVVSPVDSLVASFSTTVDLVRFRTDYSTVAVLSEDPAVIALFKQLIIDRAANAQPTELFIGVDFTKDLLIGSSAAAAIDASQTPGEQRTVSVVVGTPFATAQTGDTVRHYTSPTVYVSYVLQSVLSSQTGILTTAVPGGPLAAQTIQVWHHLTAAEQVTDVIATAQSYASDSINLVFPDTYTYAGTDTPPEFVAAYLAALRSYSLPQQGFNYVLPSIFVGPDMSAFTGYEAQLASAGVFVLDVSSLGQLFVRYPRTTDPTTMESANEVIVATAQFSIRYINSQLQPLMGLYRQSSRLYADIRTAAMAAISALKNTNVGQIGSVIVGGTVDDVSQSLSNASTVSVTITLLVAGVAEDILQLSFTIVLE